MSSLIRRHLLNSRLMAAAGNGGSGVGLQRITGGDIANHRVTVPGTADEIFSPLYDSAVYTSGTTQQLSFFTVPIGQGTTTAPGASGPKTEADTNMYNAGLLAKGNRFYCTGIEFCPYPGVNPTIGPVADSAAAAGFVNDIYALGKSGWVRFRIQNRDYISDGPLDKFPSSNRIAGFSAMCTDLTTGAATFSATNYGTWSGALYHIVPVYIEANQSFSVTCFWPAAITMPSTTNPRIFCRLRGRLIRDAQ